MRNIYFVTTVFLLFISPSKAEDTDSIMHYIEGMRLLSNKGAMNKQTNREKAFKHFQIIAKFNHPDAEFRLGRMYHQGIGTKKNEKAAFEWYKKAAIGLNPAALYYLETVKNWRDSRIYNSNHLVKFSFISTYQKNIDKKGATIQDIFVRNKKLANQGNANAQYRVASFYHQGIGMKKNEKAAFEWYKKAAEQGHARAENNLAWFYLYGEHVFKNKTFALQLYKKAAEQGLKQAQDNLSAMYFYGIGTEVNFIKSYAWSLKYRPILDKILDTQEIEKSRTLFLKKPLRDNSHYKNKSE